MGARTSVMGCSGDERKTNVRDTKTTLDYFFSPPPSSKTPKQQKGLLVGDYDDDEDDQVATTIRYCSLTKTVSIYRNAATHMVIDHGHSNTSKIVFKNNTYRYLFVYNFMIVEASKKQLQSFHFNFLLVKNTSPVRINIFIIVRFCEFRLTSFKYKDESL